MINKIFIISYYEKKKLKNLYYFFILNLKDKKKDINY